MIYIAGKTECTGAEMCRAEKAQEIIMTMTNTSVCLGHVLGGDRAARSMRAEEVRSDIEMADTVVFLPGWEKHKELQMQHMYCKYIGKRIMYFKITAKGATLTLPRNKKRRVKNGKSDKRS